MIHPRELEACEDWLEREACESVEAEEAKWRGIFAANPHKNDRLYYSTRPWLNRGTRD